MSDLRLSGMHMCFRHTVLSCGTQTGDVGANPCSNPILLIISYHASLLTTNNTAKKQKFTATAQTGFG